MTRISVLMPTRNAGRFLRIAVLSTLFSMSEEDELLVFNDGSTDGTKQILSRISDNRLKVYESESSTGIAGALNYLLSRANGRLIARMDSDDVCLPWRFSSQVREIEKSGSDVVFSGAIFFGKTPPFLAQGSSLTQREFRLALLSWCPGIHPTMLARRGVFESGIRYSAMPQEDLDLWLRMVLGGFALSRTWFPTIMYRQHEHQVSKKSLHLSAIKFDERISSNRSSISRELESASGKSAEEQLLSLTSSRLLIRIEQVGLRRFLATLPNVKGGRGS